MLGSFAGGAAATLVGAGAVLTGEAAGWWHFNLYKTPNELAWVLIISAISMAPLYLITWRVMRRFGIRGLITMNVLLAIVGPPRDKAYMSHYPEWGHYGPGYAHIIAISATYVLITVAGHCVMALVAGPSASDPLTRYSWHRASSEMQSGPPADRTRL